MSLFKKIAGEFIDIIEWVDETRDTLAWRFPTEDRLIQTGAQLIVRESQAAVFVDEGRFADLFGAGRYTLNTNVVPLLSRLKGWSMGFNSPFKSEVYFVGLRDVVNLKWGTANPVIFRDAELGPVRLRAFGAFSLRVDDVRTFVRTVVGTASIVRAADVEPQVRRLVLSAFSDAIAECRVPVYDIATKYDELSLTVRTKVESAFNAFGLTVTDVRIENIGLPPEVEAMIDKRAGAAAFGGVDHLARFNMAQSIGQTGSPAGDAVGVMAAAAQMGMGLQMAREVAGSLGAVVGGVGAGAAAGAAGAGAVDCWSCDAKNPAAAKFCIACGAPLKEKKCGSCGHTNAPQAKFCVDCGAKF